MESTSCFHSSLDIIPHWFYIARVRTRHRMPGNATLLWLKLYLHGNVSIYQTLDRHPGFLKLLEHIVVLYDKTSNLESINKARRELFFQKIDPWSTSSPHQTLLYHIQKVSTSGLKTTSNLTIYSKVPLHRGGNGPGKETISHGFQCGFLNP